MADIISPVVEMVPQLSYDIIARFVPGTIVMFSWAVVTEGPTTQDELVKLVTIPEGTSGSSVLLFLSVAYVVSIVLYGVWMLFDKLIEKLLPRLPKGIGDEIEKRFREKKLSQDLPETLVYDAIRVEKPAVGARILKLRAEARLAQVLIVGWMIALVLNLLPLIENCSMERRLFTVALVVGIVGACFFRQRVKEKHVINLKNYRRILEFDRKPWFVRLSDDHDN